MSPDRTRAYYPPQAHRNSIIKTVPPSGTVLFFSHRIESSLREWVTTHDASNQEPTSSKKPVASNTLMPILRTRGMKPAVPSWKKPPQRPVIEREGALIETDEKKRDPLHTRQRGLFFKTRSRMLSSSGFFIFIAAGRAIMTASKPG